MGRCPRDIRSAGPPPSRLVSDPFQSRTIAGSSGTLRRGDGVLPCGGGAAARSARSVLSDGGNPLQARTVDRRGRRLRAGAATGSQPLFEPSEPRAGGRATGRLCSGGGALSGLLIDRTPGPELPCVA